MCAARSACQDGAGLNERSTHGLAIDTHALRDCSHRDTAEVEPDRFGCLFYSESRTATPDAPPREVRRHRGAMHAVPVCQLVDRRTVEVVVNEAVDLAVSKRRSNEELLEGFAWGEVAQARSGAFVELFGDRGEVGLVVGDVGALGQVLTDQPVGVLVGSALPR